MQEILKNAASCIRIAAARSLRRDVDCESEREAEKKSGRWKKKA